MELTKQDLIHLEIMDRRTIRAILTRFRDDREPSSRGNYCPVYTITVKIGGNCNFCAKIFPDWATIFYIPETKTRIALSGRNCCPCHVYGEEVVRDSIRKKFDFFNNYDS